MIPIKKTSYKYGKNYQAIQAEKFKDRSNNHWRYRISLAKKMVTDYVIPRLRDKNIDDIIVVDVGCSIGTFAIEFAKMGYSSFGVDFDSTALEYAEELAKEEGVKIEFYCGDVSEWRINFPSMDIAICFDLFEHLHDDELGALLASLKKTLTSDGCIVFHTFPTQYDYIFYSKLPLRFFLIPFCRLPKNVFNRLVTVYAKLIDILLVCLKGVTYKDFIKHKSHCNPMTLQRLRDIFNRAGYKLLLMDSSDLYGFKLPGSFFFKDQPIADRNIYGVAVPL